LNQFSASVPRRFNYKYPVSGNTNSLAATYMKHYCSKMRYSLIFFLLLISSLVSRAQFFSIAAYQNNILYIGLDNAITIAVEKISVSNLIVKTDNGQITGSNGLYTYRAERVGKAEIILYGKNKKEIGRSSFRVKYIPDPVPMIGPSGGGKIKRAVLAAQQYIRAEYQCCGFDAKALIDSLTVCIIRGDTCLYNQFVNIGNKLSNELSSAFSSLKDGDTVIFKKIFAKLADGTSKPLTPFMLFIEE